jgi:plasmid stabilization system protein ParE
LSVQYSHEAEIDLSEALVHLAAENPAAAEGLLQRVRRLLGRLAQGQFDGPEERLLTGKVVRSWPVPPYRVYYERRGETLYVLRIYHQARKPIVRRGRRVH